MKDAQSWLSQFLRYFVVGGIAFGVDFSMLYVLTEWAGYYYLLSASIAFLLGLSINYTLSVYWVFDYRAVSNRLLEFFIFAVIGIMGLLLNAGIIYTLTEYLACYYLYSKLVATFIVFMFNFVTRKAMLFSQQSTSDKIILPVLPK